MEESLTAAVVPASAYPQPDRDDDAAGEEPAASLITDPEPAADDLRESIEPSAVRYVRDAGVRVALDHPFWIGDRLVEQIVLPPMHLGLSLDALDGGYENLLALLVAATGEPAEIFRALRGGDEDAVIGAFIRRLPDSVRTLIEEQ